MAFEALQVLAAAEARSSVASLSKIAPQEPKMVPQLCAFVWAGPTTRSSYTSLFDKLLLSLQSLS